MAYAIKSKQFPKTNPFHPKISDLLKIFIFTNHLVEFILIPIWIILDIWEQLTFVVEGSNCFKENTFPTELIGSFFTLKLIWTLIDI